MFSLKADDSFDVAKPLHFFSKFIGLTSFSIKEEKQLSVFVTLVDLVFLNLVSVSSVIGVVRFIFYDHQVWGFHTVSEVFRRSIDLVVTSFILIPIFANLWIFCARKSFADIFNNLTIIDKELEVMRVPVNYRKSKRKILIFILVIKCIVITSFAVTETIGRTSNLFKSDVMVAISICTNIEYTIFVIYHFTFLMMAVKQRYKRINLFLQLNFLICPSDEVRNGNEKLNQAASLHDKLVDVADKINRCYGVPVSLLFTLIIYLLISFF